MLIENDLTGVHISRSITGIGINVNQETFCSDAPNPVSLKQINGQSYDCPQILASVMKRIKTYYNLLATGKADIQSLIADRYACSLFRKEGFHRYTDANGDFMARLLRVEPDGRFILEDQTELYEIIYLKRYNTYFIKTSHCTKTQSVCLFKYLKQLFHFRFHLFIFSSVFITSAEGNCRITFCKYSFALP